MSINMHSCRFSLLFLCCCFCCCVCCFICSTSSCLVLRFTDEQRVHTYVHMYVRTVESASCHLLPLLAQLFLCVFFSAHLLLRTPLPRCNVRVLFYWILQFCFHFYWPLCVSHCCWFSCASSSFLCSCCLWKGITFGGCCFFRMS